MGSLVLFCGLCSEKETEVTAPGQAALMGPRVD